jgi:hypothetical protein
LTLSACGDDDSGSSASTSSTKSEAIKIDATKADDLAHQAMFATTDLPGSGWKVSKTDEFDNGPDGNTEACKSIAKQRSDAEARDEGDRAGRASKEFSKDGSNSPLPTTVKLEVDVYKSASAPADELALYRKAVQGPDYLTCLKDTLANDPKVTAQTKTVTPLATVPQGGEAEAYDITLTSQGQSFDFHIETYNWTYSNTGNTITVGGSKADVTADLVKAVVAKADANVKGLGK